MPIEYRGCEYSHPFLFLVAVFSALHPPRMPPQVCRLAQNSIVHRSEIALDLHRLNASGEVIGINAMIFGGDLSVAIPAYLASQFSAVVRSDAPKLGVELQPVRVQRGDQVHAALMIANIERESLAERAGLFVGDVLLAIHDQPFDSLHTLRYALLNRQHQPLNVRILRGAHETTITI